MVPHVPHSVLKNELKVLFPMVSAGLKAQDNHMRRSAAETLRNILAAEIDVVAPAMHSLVPPLLEVAVSSRYISARVAALGCLLEMLKLPHHVIFPFKEQVVKGLAVVLDDAKFKVRRAAVQCRNRWIATTAA